MEIGCIKQIFQYRYAHFPLQEPSADRELRSEVEQLRHEISTVRESLSTQIGLFADERQRWETEKAKVRIRQGQLMSWKYHAKLIVLLLL
jgi:hypothetical protein